MAVIKAGTYKFNEELYLPEEEAEQEALRQVCEFVYFDGSVRVKNFGVEISSKSSYGTRPVLLYDAEEFSIMAYSSASRRWSSEAYRRVLFETDQEVSEEFHAWFVESTTPTLVKVSYGDDIISLKPLEIATLHTDGKLLNNDLVIEVSKVEEIGELGGAASPNLISKTITGNGIYRASDDSVSGYDSVTVAVFASIYNGEYLNL